MGVLDGREFYHRIPHPPPRRPAPPPPPPHPPPPPPPTLPLALVSALPAARPPWRARGGRGHDQRQADHVVVVALALRHVEVQRPVRPVDGAAALQLAPAFRALAAARRRVEPQPSRVGRRQQLV